MTEKAERLTEIRQKVWVAKERYLNMDYGLTPQEAVAYAASKVFHELADRAAAEGDTAAQAYYRDKFFHLADRSGALWDAIDAVVRIEHYKELDS